MKGIKILNSILLIITFISFNSCEDKNKQNSQKGYFIYLQKYSKKAPYDIELKVEAQRSANLIKIYTIRDNSSGMGWYTSIDITLPKDVKPGVYNQSTPNIYVNYAENNAARHQNGSMTIFNLEILNVNDKIIEGTLEGKFDLENDKFDTFFTIKNGKFYAVFSE